MEKYIIENCDKLKAEGCNVIIIGDGKEIDEDTYNDILELADVLPAYGYKIGITNFLVNGIKFREKIT